MQGVDPCLRVIHCVQMEQVAKLLWPVRFGIKLTSGDGSNFEKSRWEIDYLRLYMNECPPIPAPQPLPGFDNSSIRLRNSTTWPALFVLLLVTLTSLTHPLLLQI